MSQYCDHCDLPLDQCVHGRPAPVVPAKPAPAVKKASPVRRSTAAQPRVETRRVGTARRTTQAVFRPVILDVLRDMDGAGQAEEILAEVGRRMESRLHPEDHDLVQDEPRWHRAARFERQAMVNDGLMDPVRERGVWQLAPRGFLND